MKDTAVLILAAGQGTRMKSDRPKVLHQVGGKALLSFPIELARDLKCTRTVLVVGHGRSEVEQHVARVHGDQGVRFAIQAEQRGTGHAVMEALGALRGHKGKVLILSGDVPLLEKKSIGRLERAFEKAGGPIAFLSFVPHEPAAYGRVVRDGPSVKAIREARDCSPAEKAIGEVNAGIYLVDMGFLRRGIKKLKTNNAQGELYLTDLVELAAARNKVAAVEASAQEVAGVNDRADLAAIEEVLRERTIRAHMRAGVTVMRPSTVSIDLGAKIGSDTVLGPGVELHGEIRIGKGCSIGTGCVITNCEVAKGVTIHPYSVINDAVIGAGAQVGPMARLRPGAVLMAGSKVGNFVELKNTVLGEGSKANHLAYLGDGIIGKGVNVGAGTIFCNYDGFMKHKTILKDGVFIGSDSQIVAPVTVGEDAYVASGSTVTKDVPAEALAISRTKQVNKLRVAGVLRRALKAKKQKQLAEKAAKEGK